jgi:hypothetical protein
MMNMMSDIPEGAMCAKCEKHKATEKWVGEGGWLAATHGMIQYWCKCCVLEEQLEYAKDQAKEIPKLKLRIKKVKCQ